MENYHRVLFRAFLDQPPKYNTPPPCTSTVPEMKALKPSSKTVAFHRHGKEVAVTLSGDNLWFCHEIKVGPHKENVMAEHVSQKSIQFNFNFKDETHNSFGSDKIKVALSSHFSNPVKATVPVVHKVMKFKPHNYHIAIVELANLHDGVLIKPTTTDCMHISIQRISKPCM